MATTKKVKDLTALGAIAVGDKLVGEKVVGQTGLITYTPKTMVGTSGKITVTDGDQVSGNPTFTIASDYAGQSSIVTVGTITSGTWTASVVGVAYGGSGRASHTAYAPIFGGSTATSAQQSGTTGISGQLAQSAGASAVFGWTTATYPTTAGTSGTRLKSNGTNWINSSTTMPDTGTTGKLIRGNGTNYVETTASFADTYAASSILYSNGANTVTGLATANNSLLGTNGTGVPSFVTDIPTAVTVGGAYVYRVGGTDVTVADGGTGLSSTTAYGVLCGGTTSTSALQSVAPGVVGARLTSTGASSLPVMKGGSASFRATLSSDQTVVSLAFTKVQCNTEVYDFGGFYDNATNYRYQPTIAGRYHFDVFLEATTNVASAFIAANIYLNGSSVSRIFSFYTVAGTIYTSCSVDLALNGTTDYVEFFAQVQGVTVKAGSSFNGHLVEPT